MKKNLFFKILIVNYLLIHFSIIYAETRNYVFTRTQTMAGDINTLEGFVFFSSQENKEFFKLNLKGNSKFNFWDDIEFESTMDIQNGFEIYDLRRKGETLGFSIFAHHITLNDISPGFKTRNIETERRHPYFKDYSWNFFLKYEKNESISINGKTYQAAYIRVNGNRPSGGMNCRPGQPGVVKIDSWYNLSDAKLLKQIFAKYLCKPFDFNLLEKDTYILQ